MINTLTVLITNNPEVNSLLFNLLTLKVRTWIFKIDNEFGGRGLATFSVDSI